MLLSVVVPCYDEAAVLPQLHARLAAAVDQVGHDTELVFVNDGSRDDTWAGMLALAARDPRLVCVNLSRNHGHQLALTAGLSECRGDLVLVIDADLQDPPELLPDMLAVLEAEGADVVYGQRAARPGETRFKRLTAHVFYRLLGLLTDRPPPADTGDFRLMTRRVVDRFLAMPERHRYVRGMISWLGFKQVPFRYERHVRAAGETHYTVRRMVRLAWDAVTSLSVKPLAIPLRVGVLCLIAAGVTLAAAGWWAVSRGELPGLGLVTVLVLALAGGQFVALGVLGEYVGRLHVQAQGRQLYLIDEVVGRAAAGQLRPAREAA